MNQSFLYEIPRMRLFVLTFAALLTGCASTSDGPINYYDVSKLEVPQPQEAHIYFMRPSAFFGGFGSPQVLVNGKKVGSLPNGSYFVHKMAPGKYDVFVDWGGGKGQYLEVTAPAGKRTYIETDCRFKESSINAVYYWCPLSSVTEIRALRILPDLGLVK